jgi:hypothetical protein
MKDQLILHAQDYKAIIISHIKLYIVFRLTSKKKIYIVWLANVEVTCLDPKDTRRLKYYR